MAFQVATSLVLCTGTAIGLMAHRAMSTADLGYDAFEFDGAAHGTAMFQNGVSGEVIGQIADTFCG